MYEKWCQYACLVFTLEHVFRADCSKFNLLLNYIGSYNENFRTYVTYALLTWTKYEAEESVRLMSNLFLCFIFDGLAIREMRAGVVWGCGLMIEL